MAGRDVRLKFSGRRGVSRSPVYNFSFLFSLCRNSLTPNTKSVRSLRINAGDQYVSCLAHETSTARNGRRTNNPNLPEPRRRSRERCVRRVPTRDSPPRLPAYYNIVMILYYYVLRRVGTAAAWRLRPLCC